jgi:hypothetical protein
MSMQLKPSLVPTLIFFMAFFITNAVGLLVMIQNYNSCFYYLYVFLRVLYVSRINKSLLLK